jgi:hypothetical protein
LKTREGLTAEKAEGAEREFRFEITDWIGEERKNRRGCGEKETTKNTKDTKRRFPISDCGGEGALAIGL